VRHDPGQSTNGSPDGLRDSAHRLELLIGVDGKSGFNNVRAERVQAFGDRNFVVGGERNAGRLLAVTQRRVKDLYWNVDVRIHSLPPIEKSDVQKLGTH